MALLRISLDPLFLLIQGTPALVSMFKCLGRVQDLLNEERVLGVGDSPFTGSETSSASSFRFKRENAVSVDRASAFFPLGPGLRDINSRYSSTTELVEISDAAFCWKGREDAPALYIMSLEIKPSSFTAVIGP